MICAGSSYSIYVPKRRTMSTTQPRQCIKCRRWFYDAIFYREGRYGCRRHGCDEIDHVTRLADWRTQPKSWWQRFKERLSNVHP